MRTEAFPRMGRIIVAVILSILVALGGGLATAEASEGSYPPPPTEPPTTVVTPAPRPPAEVPPGDLARTGLDLRGPLALGALLVLVGGSAVWAEHWYRRRQEHPAAER
jgi:hypothetical protein